ncbi:MAG: hypothetical protein WCQ99_16595, partial [Pseudomonadota bacterium]
SLNRYDKYPVLFLEFEYSKTAFFDYYLTTLDDVRGDLFTSKILRKLANTDELLQLLKKIRKWNQKHPKALLHVACNDLEFDFVTTINEIIENIDKNIKYIVLKNERSASQTD